MYSDIKGFMKITRHEEEYRPLPQRVKDHKEVLVKRNEELSKEQATRCMDCGTPFCHWGCPLGNIIPEWNEYVAIGQWDEAAVLLEATNNMPEVTGRLCPAPCEAACVLGINDDPVTIRENELDIVEHAFIKGIIKPEPPAFRTGKKVAVVGSGPAGLGCGAQLNKMGHYVTIFERDDKIGGLLRYGIPDFKMEKWVIDRRLAIFEKEGVKFRTNVNVGLDYKAKDLLNDFDAICLTGGATEARDLKIDGRDAKGIYFAMEFLKQSNLRNQGVKIPDDTEILAKGKKVVVIGGGDTGSDCIGTCNRQEAAKIIQLEVLPKPPKDRSNEDPWPVYPRVLKTTSSHKEGVDRKWSVLTKKFIKDKNGNLTGLECVEVEFIKEEGKPQPKMVEKNGSEFNIDVDMAILAIGFVHPEHRGLLTDLGLEFDTRGNVKTDNTYKTSVDKVFSAGDMRRGQSLIVWAEHEGREAAKYIDAYLMTNAARLRKG